MSEVELGALVEAAPEAMARLLELAVKVMATAMVIVKAPDGRILFRNARADLLFGRALESATTVRDLDGLLAFHAAGTRIEQARWPLVRALAGEPVVGERIEIEHPGGERRVAVISASPLHDDSGQVVGAVATYHELTDSERSRAAAEAQLVENRERTRIADRRKDEFLTMLGHELRNPLAPIVTALELMDLRGVSDGKKEREVIARQVTRLARRIDELLEAARKLWDDDRDPGAAILDGARVDTPVSLARALDSAGHPMRVLVVDDNIDAANMLCEYLGVLGHATAVAHDGATALELASSFMPDVAVLDISMPVMDGYELARRLRESLGQDRLRLIALTGYGQDAGRARSREVGFDEHLVKPVDLATLLPLLAK
jgi:CheY-like chemotaxis protein